MTIPVSLETLVLLAGVGQLLLVLGSLAIPRVLGWPEETAKLRPLTRQVFWTYAGYIWCTNLWFGLISVLAPRSLLDGSVLAGAVTAFMAVYWGARVLIHFLYFDRRDLQQGVWNRLAEALLVGLFLFLTLVYGGAAVGNLWGARS
jgi:hypothetical protein